MTYLSQFREHVGRGDQLRREVRNGLEIAPAVEQLDRQFCPELAPVVSQDGALTGPTISEMRTFSSSFPPPGLRAEVLPPYDGWPLLDLNKLAASHSPG